jgi:hypothetical protein
VPEHAARDQSGRSCLPEQVGRRADQARSILPGQQAFDFLSQRNVRSAGSVQEGAAFVFRHLQGCVEDLFDSCMVFRTHGRSPLVRTPQPSFASAGKAAANSIVSLS